jgi:hypothetical protein
MVNNPSLLKRLAASKTAAQKRTHDGGFRTSGAWQDIAAMIRQ